ncbi:MAG: aminotransferase class I/II-fold pyridoxal phosphate-dependent enzyme [Flavobacteriaceae bacterium]|nr:aminotransferase class I/II-fold pyridoxal phosphate-dependent enzyme [Flavobacteriaceae bacterium]
MDINLISDTVTIPTPKMLEFMMQAKVGDDVFNTDLTVIALQDKIAKMFGKEAALFFPSGTMANQVAIKIHTQPSEQIICDKWAHVYNFEGGGAAFNSGVSCCLLDGKRGMFTAKQVETAINSPDNIHIPVTSLVAIENTTNKGGGACWDIEEIKKIREVCLANNLAFHLDGARLFNALVAKSETPKQYGKLFDTISICLSKGLGAPIGSLLLGTKAHIKKAYRIRKLFGGAMRQVGYLAAAGIYALDNNIERLAIDHKYAKIIGEALQKSAYVSNVEPVETNIIIFNIFDSISETDFINALQKKHILISSMGGGKLRMVIHLAITDDMLAVIVEVLGKLNF